MTASELETRIKSATDEKAVRALIADFKAYKDEQLSDLTGQINVRMAEAKVAQALQAALQTATDAAAKAGDERDSLAKRLAKAIELCKNGQAEQVVADADKTDVERELDAAQAALADATARVAELAEKAVAAVISVNTAETAAINTP